MTKRIKDYNSGVIDDLRAYKEHVDLLAATLMAGTAARLGQMTSFAAFGMSISDAVGYARAIIDEVDKQVDRELEQTQYEVDQEMADTFKPQP